MDIKHCKSIIKILGYFICCILWAPAWGQEKLYPAKNNPLLSHLFHSKYEHLQVGSPIYLQHFIENDNPFFKNFPQHLLKDNNGLYLFPTSTGRLYKASHIKGDSMYFRRLDSTHFFGYNGGAAYFSFNDTIFNFGGYGMWNTNGHLRYFSENNREWNIKTLNFEAKAANIIGHLNRKTGQFFYTGRVLNQGEKAPVQEYQVTRLDLNRLENTSLGSLNPILVKTIKTGSYFPIIIDLPVMGGLFISLDYFENYFLDFENNQFYKLKNQAIVDYLNGNSRGMTAQNAFAEDSTIYFTHTKDSTFALHHFNISINDFEEKGEPLYIKPLNGYLIGGLSLLAVFFLSGFIFLKYKKKSVKTKHGYFSNMSFQQDDSIDPLHFIEEELSLIQVIHESSLQKRYFAVDDINTHMGIKRKTLEVQKKIRTEIISRINHKFRVHSEGEYDLIERVRSERDRRYFKYMIRTENMEQLKGIIQQQGGRL